MAKGKKTGGKDFKPGVVTNPNGRPPDAPELKELRHMSKNELAALFHKILAAKPEELNNFNGTVLEKWVSSIIYHGIKTGDYGRLNPFIERLFGKVKEEVSGEIGFRIVVEDYSKK